MTILPPYQDHIGLWREELAAWLPDTIFDAHVHLGPPEAMGPIPLHRLQEPVTTFTALPLEELLQGYQAVYAGKTIAGMIAFPFPLREVRYEVANEYIARLMARDPRVRGFILANPRDTASTIRQYHALQKGGARFRGVKPYYDLLGKPMPFSSLHTDMEEFVPDELLEFMDAERLILMLHTSREGMGHPGCQRFVRRITERWPHVKVILAHMGRYTNKRQFLDFMDSGVWQHPNIFLEMSSASEPDVYAAALQHRELWARLLFGSDLPFGLISGVEYNAPETGLIFLTREAYPWTDRSLHERLERQRATLSYNTYHTLHALKRALDELPAAAGDKRQLMEDIFRRNAQDRLLTTT
ncbi:MAG: amidohydrolase family protein [Verrucomicrobiae bacterium]|nr:amidohydrolase family protein [Verrucomicrobiae bacterium]